MSFERDSFDELNRVIKKYKRHRLAILWASIRLYVSCLSMLKDFRFYRIKRKLFKKVNADVTLEQMNELEKGIRESLKQASDDIKNRSREIYREKKSSLSIKMAFYEAGFRRSPKIANNVLRLDIIFTAIWFYFNMNMFLFVFVQLILFLSLAKVLSYCKLKR